MTVIGQNRHWLKQDKKMINVPMVMSLPHLHEELLGWFASQHRQFPWRTTSDPYRVLIAEKLLQQTAANQSVIDVYTTIVARYQGIVELSLANPNELQSMMGPLGLHYRGPEFVRTAIFIQDHYQGRIPDTLSDLLAIPGVGDYVARAILAFGFKQQVAIVDTNVARWLKRLLGGTWNVSANPARSKRLHVLATSLLPPEGARDWNLAILDLCAAICRPKNPKCASCPVMDCCITGTASKVDYPT